MGLLEPQHLVLIAFALLLLFGGKKIPELMRGLGSGIKEFKDAQNGTGPLPDAKAIAEKINDQPENA